MSRNLMIVLAVVALGFLAFFGFGWLMQNRNIIQQPLVNITPPASQEGVQNQGQTPQQEELDRARTRLFQEGITVRTKVDQVFPGKGFIVKDESGEDLFVLWGGQEPEQGQMISLKGTVKRITGQEEFRQEGDFPQQLETFLQSETIFIEAREVNPA